MNGYRKCGTYTMGPWSAFNSRNSLSLVTTGTGVDRLMLSEVSQAEEDRHLLFPLIHGI